MALENADYINQLDQNNPDGLDPKSQGDDHIRVIKKAIKKTFPNITGVVSATQVQLNALLAPGVIPVRGMVTMWWGDRATPPAGWLICDGLNGTPPLLDRVVLGAGTLASGVVGGSQSHTHVGTVTVAITPTALTIAQLPAHSHDVRAYSGVNGGYPGIDSQVGGSAGLKTGSVGNGEAHTHGVTSTAVVANAENLPPFLAMWYIMKS